MTWWKRLLAAVIPALAQWGEQEVTTPRPEPPKNVIKYGKRVQ